MLWNPDKFYREINNLMTCHRCRIYKKAEIRFLNVAIAALQSFLSFSWLNNMKIVQFVKGVWWYCCQLFQFGLGLPRHPVTRTTTTSCADDVFVGGNVCLRRPRQVVWVDRITTRLGGRFFFGSRRNHVSGGYKQARSVSCLHSFTAEHLTVHSLFASPLICQPVKEQQD